MKYYVLCLLVLIGCSSGPTGPTVDGKKGELENAITGDSVRDSIALNFSGLYKGITPVDYDTCFLNLSTSFTFHTECNFYDWYAKDYFMNNGTYSFTPSKENLYPYINFETNFFGTFTIRHIDSSDSLYNPKQKGIVLKYVMGKNSILFSRDLDPSNSIVLYEVN